MNTAQLASEIERSWSLSRKLIFNPTCDDEVLLRINLGSLPSSQLTYLNRRVERLKFEILDFLQSGPVSPKFAWPSRDLTRAIGRLYPRYWDRVIFCPPVITLFAISGLLSSHFWKCQEPAGAHCAVLTDPKQMTLCGLILLNGALLCDCTAQLIRRRIFQHQIPALAHNAGQVQKRIQLEILYRQV